MLPYYLVLTPIALMAAMAPARRIYPFFWVLAFVILWVFIGLRHHVGQDWNNYLFMIFRANSVGWIDSFTVAEPGYVVLLRLSGQMGFGIYGTYFLGTLIFLAGLFRYARTTPFPWIALTVAMPYLIVVISMSAARQTVAIGVLLWLAAGWNQSSLVRRIVFILLASSFHLSAISFLVLAVLDLNLRVWMKIFLAITCSIVIVLIISTSDNAEYYQRAYGSVGERIHSSGAIFHVMLNAGPAMLAFALNRRFRDILLPDAFHRQLAIIAIALIPMSLVASTPSSRFTLYLFPVSMMVIGSLPLIVGQQNFVRYLSPVFFLGLMIVWLNFANNAQSYTNYNNALFVERGQLRLCCE